MHAPATTRSHLGVGLALESRRAAGKVFRQPRPPFPACFQVTHPKIFLFRVFSGSRSACFRHASPRPDTTHADDNRTWRAYPAAPHAHERNPARHKLPAKGAGRARNAGISMSRPKRRVSGEQDSMNEHHVFAAIPPTFPCLLPGDAHEIKGFRHRLFRHSPQRAMFAFCMHAYMTRRSGCGWRMIPAFAPASRSTGS